MKSLNGDEEDGTLESIPNYPAAFALANPDPIRSRMMERSNSANTPHIWNMAFPAGVVVSIPC